MRETEKEQKDTNAPPCHGEFGTGRAESIDAQESGLVGSSLKSLGVDRELREDLYSEGILVLIRSIDRFDVQLGYRFSTYAVYRRSSRNAEKVVSGNKKVL